MYELMWNVTNFSDKNMWPTSGPAFVYSMNLGGSAAHGDYVFGWQGDTLQRAMDKNCNLNRDCPAAGLTYQAPEKYNACTIKQQAPEPVDGCKFLFSSFRSSRVMRKILMRFSNTGLKAMPMGEMAIKA